jgi:hypothetical protein
MPNGKHGDHPLTDIVDYGANWFGGDIDDSVRRLAAHPDFDTVRERVATILWDNWPHWGNVKPDFDRVRQTLAALKLELDGHQEI